MCSCNHRNCLEMVLQLYDKLTHPVINPSYIIVREIFGKAIQKIPTNLISKENQIYTYV